MLGLDIRFVVTSLDVGSAEWIYDSLYCARGQAENLIKLHKTQLASDRTSCRSALANQVRLVLHTAAYWLMLTVRDAIPKVQELHVPKPTSSAACPARCCRSVLDRRGVRPSSPDPSLKRVAKYRSSGGEKPKAILCASSEQICDRPKPRTLMNRTG